MNRILVLSIVLILAVVSPARDEESRFIAAVLKGPSFETPLGILRLKNTTYLFLTEHGWEDESYLILELDNSGLHKVLETEGG